MIFGGYTIMFLNILKPHVKHWLLGISTWSLIMILNNELIEHNRLGNAA
jgi:hypothetical protein